MLNRGVLHDLTYSARILLKRPGTSALAVVALALGIGLTGTMFSIVNGVFLRGLPFERSDRILYVGAVNKKAPNRPAAFVAHDYLDIRSGQRSFEDLAAYASLRADLVGDDAVPMRYDAARLTPNALRVLRVQPVIGHGFTESDAAPGAAAVALISEGVWTARFHRAGDIVGRVVRLNGRPATIVGVLPGSLGFPETEQVWLPLTIDAPPKRSDGMRVQAFGRLRDGVSIAQANAELAGIAGRLEQQHPENADRTAAALPFIRRFIPQRTIATFSTMLAAVFGVLLIACVNVANLQLARAAERTKEVAVRLALGAPRGRVLRQLLFEGLLLAVAGALAGLGLARIGTEVVNRAIANEIGAQFWIDVRIDGAVLLFVVALTAVAAVTSSLAPALRVTRGPIEGVLRGEGRGATSGRMGRFSRTLVVAQIALSFALLMASGLAIKSIANTSLASLPFRTDVLAARLDLTGPAYKDDAALRQVLESIHGRVAALPGVTGTAFVAGGMPGISGTIAIEVEGEAVPSNPLSAEVLSVSPEYLEVMRLSTIQGRVLRAQDRAGSEAVALVTEDFVRHFLAGKNAIGRRVQIGRNNKTIAWRTIVGVLPDLAVLARDREIKASVIVPFDQRPSRGLVELLVASTGDPLAPTLAVRRAIAEIDATIAIDRVTTVQGRFDQQLWAYRILGGLFSAFGVSALVLASAGLYGVMAFAVRRRTAEIGIRMALGADRRRILSMVLRQGGRLLAIGITLGAALGVLLGSQLTQLLFNVSPWDVAVFATTFVVLAGAGGVASLVPARRAAAVDPLVALRQE